MLSCHIVYIVVDVVDVFVNFRIVIKNFSRNYTVAGNNNVFILFGRIEYKMIGAAFACNDNFIGIKVNLVKRNKVSSCFRSFNKSYNIKSISESYNAEAQRKNKSKNKSKCFFHVSFPPKIFF